MSEVRLIVREAACDWSGTIHGSCAERAVAALSADPVTMEELEAAMERFAQPTPECRFLGNLSPGLCAEPYDAGLVVIDLLARLVVTDSTYCSHGPAGSVWYHNGHCGTDTALRYHLADDWLLSSAGDQWEHLSERRRRERAATPNRDARRVFYGRPMLEFVARETFAAFTRRDEIAEDAPRLADAEITPEPWPGQERSASPFYDTLKQIHAAWLLTPRDDLGGACPREVALDRHEHLMNDLQDRCDQWSRLGKGPRGLAESSHAFQHGGFGTHEIVMYYELVRGLLWSCWEQLTERAQSPPAGRWPAGLTVGDFLATEVPRLESVLEALLDTPDPELDGRTPRSIITRERARLPEAMSGHDAMIDPDCPCCQMMDEMCGPGFWHLDGSGMDDDFAFDFTHPTRKEWDEEQRRWEELGRRLDAESAERRRLGIAEQMPGEVSTSAGWSRSFSVGPTADVPLGIRVFAIGCQLAELIDGLRAGVDRETTAPAAQRHIDELNRDFGNLRELLQSSDSSLAEALFDPVLSRFADTLDTTAAARPDLALRCKALTSSLHKLLDPPTRERNWLADDQDDLF